MIVTAMDLVTQAKQQIIEISPKTTKSLFGRLLSMGRRKLK